MAGISCILVAVFFLAANGPLISEEEFFAKFSAPGVREAGAAGDVVEARRLVVEHLKNRKHPRWYVPVAGEVDEATAPRDVDGPRPSVKAAEKALRREFTVAGVTHRFEGEIDWSFNPTLEPDSPHPRNYEWLWQLNRHRHWADLGLAWRATGDERYMREFVGQLRDWLATSPPPPQMEKHPRTRWRTIDAGIRMSAPWPNALYLFLGSPWFDDELVVAMLRSFVDHARYLMAYPTDYNWLCQEMGGLYTAGALLPEFSEAAEWRRFAMEKFEAELGVQFYPDGAQVEMSPGVHNKVIEYYLNVIDLARMNEYAVSEGLVRGLEPAFHYDLALMTPGGDLPRFNDSWHIDVPDMLAKAFKLFPHRADFQWAATGGREGAKPAFMSMCLPHSGLAVLRTGWGKDACYLAFDAGPYGTKHQHEDKLTFVLTGYGREFIVDAGDYAFDSSQWRDYVRSTYGHNTAIIDGKPQIRRTNQRNWEPSAEPSGIKYGFSNQRDWVEGTYGGELEGYGKKREWLATHRRRIELIKTGEPYFVITDMFEPRDGRAHTYEVMFHFDAPALEFDAETKSYRTTFADGANVTVAPDAPEQLEAELVTGQEEPIVQGWVAEGHGKTGVRPAPTVIYRKTGEGAVVMRYVFKFVTT